MYHNFNILKCDGSYLPELLDLESLIKFSFFFIFLSGHLLELARFHNLCIDQTDPNSYAMI
jgi:hypothetical protein